MTRSSTVLAAAFALALGAACEGRDAERRPDTIRQPSYRDRQAHRPSDSVPFPPPPARQPGRHPGPKPDLDRLAYEKQIPGFGGFYFRGNNMHVVLTDTAQIARAREILLPYLRARPGREHAHIVAEQGRYAFSELFAWKTLATRNALGRGVRMVGVSIQDNKVSIHVADPDDVPHVLERLTELGVPREALLVR